MKRTFRYRASLTALISGLTWLAGSLPAEAMPTADQTLHLSAGWNAIYLEVEPLDTDPAAVFATLPSGLTLESVWTWDSGAALQFIQDPEEGLANQPGWRPYYAAGRPEAFLSKLHAILGNRAYLLKLGGQGTEVAWTVKGRPSVRKLEWTSDSFNLRGFSIDPQGPPTFAAFFAASPAHADQPMYQLDASGTWQPVNDATPMHSGEAYYVYCKGGSSYAGPIELELEQSDGLNFGEVIGESKLKLRRLASGAGSLSVGLLQSSNPVPLAYYALATTPDPDSVGNSITKITWPPLPASLSLPAPSGQNVHLRLAVRRASMASDTAESVLAIRDGAGTRLLVPVSAARHQRAVARRGTPACSLPTGLWIGTVTANAVSESQTDPNDLNDPNTIVSTPTAGDTGFRILVHVDAGCQARLLKNVVMMWQNGQLGPSPDDPDLQVVTQPGRYVLLTDDTRIPEFEGASLRDGEAIGYRLSAVAYDFDEPAAGPGQILKTLRMDGTFALGNGLSATLRLGADSPTNPFLHRFHPDHDNRDGRGTALPAAQAEAFALERRLQLRLASTDPQDTDGDAENDPRPDWAVERLEGSYRETITGIRQNQTYGGTPVGLHKNPILVEGTFTLRLASSIDVLNQ